MYRLGSLDAICIFWDLSMIHVSPGISWCMHHLISLDDICIIWYLSIIYVSSGISWWCKYHLISLNDKCIIWDISMIYVSSGNLMITMPKKNFAVNWTSIYDSCDGWTIKNYTMVKKYIKKSSIWVVAQLCSFIRLPSAFDQRW